MNRSRSCRNAALAALGLSAALALLCVSASCQERPTSLAQCAPEDLLHDIALLEQFNRLNLRREQIKRLLTEARTLQKQLEAFEQQRRQELLGIVSELEQKRSRLLQDAAVPPETAAKIAAALKRADALVEKADRAVGPAGARVRAALSSAQVTILLGEDEQLAHALEVIEGFRAMTNADFEENARPYVAEITRDTDALAPTEVLTLLRSARKMAAAEYRRNRSDLARRLVVLYVRDEAGANQALGELLLDDRLIPVLSDLLQQSP